MQRRSFVKRLCGVVLAGLAAPRVGMAATKLVVVVDPAAPFIYSPMVGGAYAPGEAFSLTRRCVTMPMTYRGKQIGEIPVWVHDR